MRFTHILVVFVALIVAASCSHNDIEVHSTPEHASQYLQVVGRVAQYSDCNVATRSKKEGDEPKVTSMGLALFPIGDDGTIDDCLYYDFELGGSIVFIVDRHDAIFNSYVDKPFAMYIFANMQDAGGFPKTAEDGVGKSLEYFTKCAATANANVEDVPANGFPMMGSLGNTTNINGIGADGITLILKPAQTDANVDGLPLVNGSPTDNLEIPLKSMYAKFTFTISVKSDQEIVGNKAPRFDLISYEVNNIAATVDANSETNNDETDTSSGSISMGNYAQGATTAKFDFYLPERYLTPTRTIDDVLPAELKKKTYDESVDADQNGYRDEDEKYHQRFKNLLIEGQAATYVTITGKFTDHQEHTYDVDYKIYLGANNYDDFNIIRNTHYDNNITIRGIDDSNDQSAGGNYVSIDWRVNIERSTPLVIGLRRETLLDAHYEVRPLRLHLVGENIPTGKSATVQLLNVDGTTNNLPNWIRLEASGNTTAHITTATSTSAGKRKYFTTDLVTNTLKDNTQVTVNNLTGNTQAVWIYVDENTTTQSRTAIVRVTYDNSEPQDYKIVQEGLHAVTSTDGDRTYYIERYEEYLYNFDTADLYAQTKEEGMPWGLNGVQLSKDHNSFKIDENNTDWNNYVKNNPLLKYDFYIGKYDDFADNSVLHNYAGQQFTSEIFTKSNGEVKKLTMEQQATGAVEYCYNKNKRKANGDIAEVVWYLPSADELEDFIVPAYNSYKEFQANYYWTSQPAYIRNAFYYEYKSGSTITDAYAFIAYKDNPNYARATKVVSLGNNQFDYAKSGLNATPTPYRNETGRGEINFGYFYEMPAWKRTGNNRWTTPTFKKTDNNEFNGDQEFTEKKDGRNGSRYHIHLGHLDDMLQEGYHPRTKSNRVRCVRVAPN